MKITEIIFNALVSALQTQFSGSSDPAMYNEQTGITEFPPGGNFVTYAPQDAQGNSYESRSDYLSGKNAYETVTVPNSSSTDTSNSSS